MFVFILLALASALFAQEQKWGITQDPKTVKVNDRVVIEVVDLKDDSPALQIDWTKRQGEGNFDGATNKKKVAFIPTKPGDLVILICNVSGGLKAQIPHEFKVAGESAPVVVAQAIPAAQLPKPIPQAPPPAPEPLPAGAVQIEKIVDSNEASVIPAGFMADANTTAVSLVGGVDCKFDAGCFRFGYDLSQPKKEGWAGFAWQVVPQGEKWNWGEHKGKDLSGRGFKSFRVWAKIEPGPTTRVRAEFKSGGNVEPKYATTNRPTYLVSSGLVPVEGTWREVCLDLSRSDLRNVVSPFTVVVSGVYNPPVSVALDIDGGHYSTQPCQKAK